ncbi:hypothetical protein N9Y74_00365 [Alphaproteobacteria bacterium]|nr:hypothetical protein [Alphaproteobacteria bacterium]
MSLSFDNGYGGIAKSLVTYAQACKLAGIDHSLITANGSPAIDTITQNQDGAVFSINKNLLRAHLYTGFVPGIPSIFIGPIMLYIGARGAFRAMHNDA